MFPLKIGVGSVEVIITPKTRFETGDQTLPIFRELSSSWEAVKHIVDGFVREKYEAHNFITAEKAKMNTIKDIYRSLGNEKVDETELINEALKTGKFSEEARTLARKLIEERDGWFLHDPRVKARVERQRSHKDRELSSFKRKLKNKG